MTPSNLKRDRRHPRAPGTKAGIINEISSSLGNHAETTVEAFRNRARFGIGQPIRRAQADLALINQELGHRLKNILAMVQSIASQTLVDECGSGALKAFSERIIARGQARDILLRRGGSSASLREVIAASTEPHGGAGQIEMLGPDFAIGSRAAVMLSLMLNELATNVVKYDALATPACRIALAWQIEDDQFAMSWHERGGPDVAEPMRIGFG